MHGSARCVAHTLYMCVCMYDLGSQVLGCECACDELGLAACEMLGLQRPQVCAAEVWDMHVHTGRLQFSNVSEHTSIQPCIIWLPALYEILMQTKAGVHRAW